ncbi:MAG TPA: glycoside hydrolase family 38 C-terminal domain-containing protein, partial [Bacteroidota bacterium]|nr:glycoside hydrolase family 38 C-terminal domain-containing protein [Bacteroidota bacterium]
VNYSVNGNKTDSRTMEITPVKQRSIYFIPHTHNDIGYTDLQPDVRAKQWHHLDQALELIKKTKDYPEDSRYKWNLEILWSLESWLQNASPEKKEEFIADVRAGSIGMNALLVNPLTGLANATEMSHFTEFARKFSEQYGIPITTAAVSDVPGFTWGMVPMLAQSGVKYFASGPNTGDRIGYVIDDWGDKPFYWDSQSGSERVLFWVAGSGYSSFHQATLANGGPERVMKIIRKLDATNYPYDIYYMPYTLGDNGGNDTTLSDFVRQWNERYISPRLVIATHKQLFTDFIKEYGDSLPVHKGDFTPYWEDGAVSTANETALDRAAVDRLTQGEALWSMRAPERFPDSVAYAAWRNVTLWDEHTWGADISVSDPDSAKTTGQWKIKRQYALDADSLSKALVASAVHQDKSESSTFDIVNTSSWPRTDVVMLTKGQSAAGDHASDMNEKPLRAQRLSTGELAVFVNDIPPMGAKRIRISKGKSARSARLKMINNTLTFGKATIAIDPNNGGIRKLRWKETPDSSMTAQGIKGIPRKNATHESEFVDTTRGQGVNEFLYVPGINSDSTLIVRNVKVAFIEQGDLLVRIRVTADAPGCNSYSYTVTLYSKIDRIDLETNIDKKAIREKEGAHIAFPFNIPGGKLRYDVAAGIITPEDDQLTGACKNFFSVASWADVSNDSMGVTVATLDAPLIEMGAINAERPWMKSIAQSATFYSYVLNNYWHTNYKADQSGPIRFAYSLWPHKQYASEDAARFGAERRAPLIVAPVNDGEPVVTSLCTVTPSAIEVSSIKPIEAGKSLLVFLYNPSNANQTVGIVWKDETNLMMYRSDAFGHKESGPIGNMRIRPYGTEYLLAEWK